MQVQAVNHIKAYTQQARRGDHIQHPGGIPEGLQGKVTKRTLDLRLGKLGIEFKSQELDTDSLASKRHQAKQQNPPNFDAEMDLALKQIQSLKSQAGQEQTFSNSASDSQFQRMQALKAYAKQQNSQDFTPGYSMLEVLI